MGDFKKDKQETTSDALERESRGKQNRSVRGFVGEGKKEKVIGIKNPCSIFAASLMNRFFSAGG